MLKIEHLTKKYDQYKAVDDLSLHIERGHIYGFIGHNGAGKTTTALGIMNLVPDPPGRIVSGQILYNGEDLAKKAR